MTKKNIKDELTASGWIGILFGLGIFFYGIYSIEFALTVILGIIIGIWMTSNGESRGYSKNYRAWLFTAGVIFSTGAARTLAHFSGQMNCS